MPNSAAYATLIGGVFFQLASGISLLWGGISLYTTSYFRQFEPKLSVDDTFVVFPIFITFFIGTSPFAVKIIDLIGARPLGILVIGFSAVSLYLSALVKSFSAFVILYALIFGLFSGPGYMLPLYCGWLHFPQSKGLVSGLSLAGYGMGPFLFNFIARYAVNPLNEGPSSTIIEGASQKSYFGPEIYQNVPYMLKVLSLSYAAFGFIGALLINVPGKEPQLVMDASQRRYDDFEIDANKQPQERSEDPPLDLSLAYSKMLSREFMILLFCASTSAAFGTFINLSYKNFGLVIHPDDQFITSLGSWGALANGLGRIGWGLLQDRFQFRIIYRVMGITLLLLAVSLSYAATHKILFGIWIILIYLFDGGHLVLFPTTAVKVFGVKLGPFLYGYISWGWILANFLNLILIQLVLKWLGYATLFLIYAVIIGMPMLLVQLLKENGKED